MRIRSITFFNNIDRKSRTMDIVKIVVNVGSPSRYYITPEIYFRLKDGYSNNKNLTMESVSIKSKSGLKPKIIVGSKKREEKKPYFNMIESLRKMHYEKGKCCGAACKSCIFIPKGKKGSIEISDDPSIQETIQKIKKEKMAHKKYFTSRLGTSLIANISILPGVPIHLVAGSEVEKKCLTSIEVNGRHIVDPSLTPAKRSLKKYNCRVYGGMVITNRLIVKGEELLLKK